MEGDKKFYGESSRENGIGYPPYTGIHRNIRRRQRSAALCRYRGEKIRGEDCVINLRGVEHYRELSDKFFFDIKILGFFFLLLILGELWILRSEPRVDALARFTPIFLAS